MPLTDLKVRNAKSKPRPYRLFDERGLYLEVAPKGGKWWRFKYRIAGREKRISLGVYPDVLLQDARDRRDEARKQVANGIDPSVARKAEKQARTDARANSFEIVAREWFEKNKERWSESHGDRILRRLERDIFPYVGRRPTAALTPPELLRVLRHIENRGAIETAHRALQNCGQIMRYAIASGRAERDIAADLKGAISPPRERHFPTITDPDEIGQLLRAIDGYSGGVPTKCALRLAPLTFVRPGELRRAEWSEFDWEMKLWKIPKEKMKGGVPHLVPLSRQALEILRELEPHTGQYTYLFPGQRSKLRPMSENTINGALRRLGYSKDELVGHGFRSMAATHLNEHQWNPDAVEVQLAHRDGSVRGVYNYAKYLDIRTEMMQWWADWLDGLRTGDGGSGGWMVTPPREVGRVRGSDFANGSCPTRPAPLGSPR